MPSIDFTYDELDIIYADMLRELDDWEIYHSKESVKHIRRIIYKIDSCEYRLWTRWDAWRAGVREAEMEDGMTWTPETHPDFAEMNEWYDRGKNCGRRILGIND